MTSEFRNLSGKKSHHPMPNMAAEFFVYANGRASVLEPVSLRFIHLTLSLDSASHFWNSNYDAICKFFNRSDINFILKAVGLEFECGYSFRFIMFLSCERNFRHSISFPYHRWKWKWCDAKVYTHKIIIILMLYYFVEEINWIKRTKYY